MSNENGFSPLVDTIAEHKDTFADLIDAGLEAAEQIPLIGWAVKAWQVQNSYQVKKLHRNTQKFLETTSITDAQKFIARFSSDEDKENLTDSVIQVLFESEKPYKAGLAANVINSIYEDKISVKEANDLLLIILNASIPALQSLGLFYTAHPKGYASTLSDEARSYGPLLMSMGALYVHGNMTRISRIGVQLYENAF